ncbi:hypothetical protein [Campylobacter fetus]|uniref:hypothetical protein n=1 Tax=Campylobacter fetus TaxID=196 RepID=UPI00053226B6|nr:hypothetical protein [Campylobacter fetus]KGT36598.1 hypothetical protein KU70_04530 [Campylobacter fetus]MBD3865191.1 hypothetical protein [Campylobacter fetus]
MFSLASMGTSTPWMSVLDNSTMSNGFLDINKGFGIGPLKSKVPSEGMNTFTPPVDNNSLFGNMSKGEIGMGLAQLGTNLFNAFQNYQNYKLQKDYYNFQKSILEENMARQRHEWARQDKNRANISNAWNNGKSYSESLAASGMSNQATNNNMKVA